MRRPPSSFNSLFWRLFAGLIVVMLLTAAASWAAACYVQSRELARLQNSLSVRYSGQRAVETAYLMYRYAGKEGLVDWLKSDANKRPTVFATTREGKEITGREVPARAEQLLEELQRERAQGSDRTSNGKDAEKDEMSAVRTVEIEGRPYTFFAVHTALPPMRINPFPFNSTTPAVAALASILLFTLLIAWFLASFYSRPLRRLDEAMRQFASGNFSVRVAKTIGPADSEAAALASVFDGMADQIEKLITRQRRLFHDVSHEVRSPLARIDVALELARIDAKRVPGSLERIEKEVRAIDRLIDGLLAYARLEGGVKLEAKPLSVRALLQEALDSLAFEAQRKQITVKLTDLMAEDVVLNANEDALKSAISNIGRNALRYTPEGGQIRFELVRLADGVLVRCIDQGPGIPEEELPRLFDPFVRGSREQTGTGFGLGLAITKSAVTSQGGRIAVKNIQPHGLQFEVTLPAPKAHPKRCSA